MDRLAYIAVGEALASLADPAPFLEGRTYESHSIAAGATQPLNNAERYETGGGLVLYVYRADEPGARAALVKVLVVSAAELAGSGGRVILSLNRRPRAGVASGAGRAEARTR